MATWSWIWDEDEVEVEGKSQSLKLSGSLGCVLCSVDRGGCVRCTSM